MTTGEGLTGSESVRKLQTVLHVRAKEEPGRRFHALCDKVWREDFLAEAWRQVRHNGGSAGVDGESFAAIELHGVEGWLGELARDLRDGTYKPQAVRSGTDPEETARDVPTVGDTVHPGPGGADVGHACAGADF